MANFFTLEASSTEQREGAPLCKKRIQRIKRVIYYRVSMTVAKSECNYNESHCAFEDI